MTTSVVTGGSGFLGSHLCETLLARGHRVICIDNLDTGSLANIGHLRGPEFDFRHEDVTEPFFVDEPVDFVFHFASPASPIDYLRLPLQTLKVGSYGTHHALGLAKRHRARFLTASTSEVYGDPQVHPQPESYWGHVNPIGPRGVYDEAKRYAEALTMAYHRQQGVDTAIVRIFNTYGPRMRPHDGRAIPTFLRQALQDKPITVFGTGQQTRSFCYVSDLVDGILRLAESGHHQPVNIGNPNEFTLLELADAVIEITGSRSEIVFEALPTDDPQVRRPDISLARELLELGADGAAARRPAAHARSLGNRRAGRTLMNRALVTGGAGFIGSTLVDALLAENWEVDVVDDLSSGRPANLEQALGGGARLHEVDIRDTEALTRTVAAARPRVIFHLAAQIDVRHSVTDPVSDARTNFQATYEVLEAARANGVEHIVYSSTGGAVYGAADTLPTPETAPIRPLAPYGQSKYAGEGAVALYQRLHGLGATVLRYANVYGPRQHPLGESGVVAILCGMAMRGGTPVIYGDGRQTRDFTYVDDVVKATLLAARRRFAGPLNIGTGRETSILELVSMLDRIVGRRQRTTPTHEDARAGEVPRSCLDVARAERELGWHAQTRLEDGLRMTLDALSSGKVCTDGQRKRSAAT